MATEEQILNVDVRFESDDRIYIAEVRELQGCIAMGRDHVELEANLKSAISDYMEIFEASEVLTIDGSVTFSDDLEQHSEIRVLAGC